MKLQHNVPLSQYTSFGVGGRAENFIEILSTTELLTTLKGNTIEPITVLGYGSNTLISDKGLPGLVLRLAGGSITIDGAYITADAGCWWDDIVKTSIDHELWGIELLSEIPGSLGAALYINITAYGQSIGPLVEWIDVWNPATEKVERIQKDTLQWNYKQSIFQTDPHYQQHIILRACLNLSRTPNTTLTYQKALDIAEEFHLNQNNLSARRNIIHIARTRAGSIWDPTSSNPSRTAGSFFRNPTVTKEIAEHIMTFDESGKTSEQIKRMNLVHGGSETRVSAAHIMLAAGFRRGQRWGAVKLNDKNLLKIEAEAGATAENIYAVMQEIQVVCKHKLGIILEPEVCLRGEF